MPDEMPSESPKSKSRTLSKDKIFSMALALVDEEGLSSLSLRALGNRLGVSQTAFYRHVPDKSALLEGVSEKVWELALEHFLSDISQETQVASRTSQNASALSRSSRDMSALGHSSQDTLASGYSSQDTPTADQADWKSYLRTYAQTLHATLLDHPNAIMLVLTHPISTPGQLSLIARVLADLSKTGFTAPLDMLGIVTAITVYTTGFAASEAAPPAGDTPDEAASELSRAMESLPADELASLSMLIGDVMEGKWDFSAQFERGLNAILKGWE